jgi:hypothetical protein
MKRHQNGRIIKRKEAKKGRKKKGTHGLPGSSLE